MGVWARSSLPSVSSLIGNVTPRRLARVLLCRWYVVFGCVASGAGVAAAICAFLPPVYESVSTFTLDLSRAASAEFGDAAAIIATAEDGMSFAELFNTRYAEWRSEPVILGLLRAYRAKRPGSVVTDEEVVDSLRSSVIDVKPYSRLVRVTVRASTPQLCTDLSKAYVDAIFANAEKENEKRRERASKLLDEAVARQRARVTELERMTAFSRVTNSVDSFKIDLDIASRGLAYVTSEILRLEGEEARLIEYAKLLDDVSKDPSAYGRLVAGDSRSAEIARLARECDDLERKCRTLLGGVTKKHPVVRQAGRELLAARARLKAAARRAADNGRAALKEIRPRIEALERRREKLEGERTGTERQIAVSEEDVSRDARSLAAARTSLQALLIAQNRLSTAAETGRETVVPGCPPTEPDRPVVPDPCVVYPVTLIASLFLGVVLVLIMDRLDDPLLDLWDVMRRTGRPVLAMLPRVRCDSRGDVVRLLVDSPGSDFAERIRGLRQLLDSPRFEIAGHRVLIASTCPGEGKTVTAAALAVAFAQSGRRTLLVDFDMRRPQQASLWKLSLGPESSLSHVLTAAGSRSPDFPALVQPSGVAGLDVIASLPPDGVDPATLSGSTVVKSFFSWARLAYDGIVVDAPPFGAVADVVPLANLVDSVILMCRPDRTNAGDLASCVIYLSETGAEVLGVVVNEADFAVPTAFSVGHDERTARSSAPNQDRAAFDETRQFADDD